MTALKEVVRSDKVFVWTILQNADMRPNGYQFFLYFLKWRHSGNLGEEGRHLSTSLQTITNLRRYPNQVWRLGSEGSLIREGKFSDFC